MAVGLALLVLLYAPRPARANGRFPMAQVLASPDDGQTLVLRATFGLLLSRDGGASWSWVCEQGLGFDGMWDPPVTVTPVLPGQPGGGRIFVGLEAGLRVIPSVADPCRNDEVTALRGEQVVDLTEVPGAPAVLVATAGPGKPSHFWRERSGTFERLGKGLDGVRVDTVEVAPSRPSRVYATGVLHAKGPKAHLFRSDDGGVTWSEPHPGLPRDGRLFISSVAPRDPARILVRQLHDDGSDVLLSTDGGDSFRVVLHTTGAMTGFARTQDGARIFAGSANAAEGLFVSRDGGETWAAGAKTPVLCLLATGRGLYLCSNPFVPGGYAVGRSTDEGATVAALSTFDAVGGAVACDGGLAVACGARWPEVKAVLAATASAMAPPPPPSASPTPAAPPSALPAEAPPPRSSCHCTTPSRGPSSASAAMVALAVITAFAWRRRGSEMVQRPSRRRPTT